MSEQLAQLEKKGGGGAKFIHIDLYLPAYYNQNPNVEFDNIGWTTATLLCNATGSYDYWKLLLYGDGVLIATAILGQGAITVDVSQYSKLKVGVPTNGNTFGGWLELS